MMCAAVAHQIVWRVNARLRTAMRQQVLVQIAFRGVVAEHERYREGPSPIVEVWDAYCRSIVLVAVERHVQEWIVHPLSSFQYTSARVQAWKESRVVLWVHEAIRALVQRIHHHRIRKLYWLVLQGANAEIITELGTVEN